VPNVNWDTTGILWFKYAQACPSLILQTALLLSLTITIPQLSAKDVCLDTLCLFKRTSVTALFLIYIFAERFKAVSIMFVHLVWMDCIWTLTVSASLI
jgi:hypothetical protein